MGKLASGFDRAICFLYLIPPVMDRDFECSMTIKGQEHHGQSLGYPKERSILLEDMLESGKNVANMFLRKLGRPTGLGMVVGIVGGT